MMDVVYGIGLNLPLIFALGAIAHTVATRLNKRRTRRVKPIHQLSQKSLGGTIQI
jgi:hypothetical protein